MNEYNENVQLTEIEDKTAVTADAEKGPAPAKRWAFLLLFAVSVLFGCILAALRSAILFGEYDNRICLYPNGIYNTALNITILAFLLVAALLAYILLRGEGKYTVKSDSVGMIFSQSLASFSFAALAFSVVYAAKKAQVSIPTFDSVLIVLSLVAAVAFFSEAFANKDTLGVDASVVLKLFASASCLFITFYFYFDQTTAIHNSNKKIATLAFAAALTSIFYGTKALIKKTNKILFVSLNMLCVGYSMMYSIPNLIWYFKMSEPLLLGVFFDVVSLALGLLSAFTLLSFERVEADDACDEPSADAESDVTAQKDETNKVEEE